MKLCAIYNCWDGVELLRGSMMCLKDHVDMFVIVYQKLSNFGEHYNPLNDIQLHGFTNVVLHQYEPDVTKGGAFNERIKRNVGVEIARRQRCTHFLHVDCDEYYEDFGAAKQAFIDTGKQGSVVGLYSYFKSPQFRFLTPDDYYVPFIHELREDTLCGQKRFKYPFYVDPTRTVNTADVILLPGIYMDHFSWVRKDINRKARNSSAKANIERSTLLEDYLNCDAPKVIGGKELILVDNQYNISI
jgi:hypothetical protein